MPLRARNGEIRAHVEVDPEDLAVVCQHTWRLGSHGYAHRGERIDGKYRSVLLHRVLLGLGFGDKREGDHRNGDKLDCRRENLRIVDSRSEQMQNYHSPGKHSSRFRGVTWDKRRGRWMARAKKQGRFVFLGYFDDEEAAADTVAEWRLEHMPFSEE